MDKKQTGIAEHAKGGSTLTYSLENRRLLSYNTPRYLCEHSGKIVVNIKVDSDGIVYETYINDSSNSNNDCVATDGLGPNAFTTSLVSSSIIINLGIDFPPVVKN